MPPPTHAHPVLFLIGPTAAGKSEVALRLARRLHGEIVSADSMQIYQDMDIGTAKPTPAERRKVRHHLLDVIPPTKSFSVYYFHKKAIQAIKAIARRGRLPIVVGGTGLYIRSLLTGLAQNPGADPAYRKQMEKQAQQEGPEALWAVLNRLNPAKAQQIDPRNVRRVIRALEISKQTGDTCKGRSEIPPLQHYGFLPVVIGMTRPRPELYAAINRRVERMFRRGWVNEVKRLQQRKLSQTARQALGYKDLLAFFATANAKKPISASILHPLRETIQRQTRRFAKRQLTWFRREQNVHWIEWKTGQKISDITRCAEVYWRQKSSLISELKSGDSCAPNPIHINMLKK